MKRTLEIDKKNFFFVATKKFALLKNNVVCSNLVYIVTNADSGGYFYMYYFNSIYKTPNTKSNKILPLFIADALRPYGTH